MYIYAVLFALKEAVSLERIDIGYINIPKKEMDNPRILKSGQLSKDKAQNVTYDKYVETINELNLNIADYEDFLDEIKGRKLVSIQPQPINVDMAFRIMENIDNVVKDMNKGYVLEKCSFMCKKCPYIDYCKYNKPIKKEN
jgi:CRISPR/Cas system-associated exonuclease Cas4 (RecB family)